MINLVGVSVILCILQLLEMTECKAEPPKREKQVIFTKVEYEVNKELMTMDVNLKNNTGSTPTVDLDSELFIDIPNDIYINNIISRRTQTEYHALIKTGKIGLCDLFKNPDREPFLKILLGNLDKYGHMMFKCPVNKGKYYLKDFMMESNTLPSFTPAGDYRVDFVITRKEKDAYVLVFRMLWYATIIN